MKRTAKQEIEIKLRVEEPAALRRKLRRLGARAERRVREMNELFDTPRGTLRKSGQLLRLRTETPLGRKGKPRYVLTYKGPLESGRGRHETQGESLVCARTWNEVPGGKTQAPSSLLGTSESLSYPRYKVRAETEFILPDPRGFLAVVGPSGMRRTFRYEKIRTSYSIPRAGGVHLDLDETPFGPFLELEGPRRAIDRLARRLGYGPGDYITSSYVALHFEDCRQRGVRAGDMMFRSRKK